MVGGAGFETAISCVLSKRSLAELTALACSILAPHPNAVNATTSAMHLAPRTSYFVHRTSHPLTSYRPHPLPYPHDLLPPHHRPPLPPRRRRPLEYRRLLHQGDSRRRHQHHLLPLPLRRPTACPRRGRPPIPPGAGYRRFDRSLRAPSRPLRGRDQADHRRQRHLPPVHRPALCHRLRPGASRRAAPPPSC